MRFLCRVLAVMLAACVCVKTVAAQGVTTASISGIVTDANRKPICGANVMVVHGPSGTRYTTQPRADKTVHSRDESRWSVPSDGCDDRIRHLGARQCVSCS